MFTGGKEALPKQGLPSPPPLTFPEDRDRDTHMAALKKSKTVVAEKKAKKSTMPPVEERKHTKDFIAEPPKAGLKEYSKIKALKAKIAELTAECQELLQGVETPFGRDQGTGFSFFDDEGKFTTLLPRKGKWFIRGEMQYKPGVRPGPKSAGPKPAKAAKAKPAKAEKKAAAAKPKKKKLKKSKVAAELESGARRSSLRAYLAGHLLSHPQAEGVRTQVRSLLARP